MKKEKKFLRADELIKEHGVKILEIPPEALLQETGGFIRSHLPGAKYILFCDYQEDGFLVTSYGRLKTLGRLEEIVRALKNYWEKGKENDLYRN